MKRIKKIISIIIRNLIKLTSVFSTKIYMKCYIIHLKSIGVNIQGKPSFIAPSVYFDGADYSKISLGHNITISFDVVFLTHDGSMHTVCKGLDVKNKEVLLKKDAIDRLVSVKEISIGKNSFIGARSTLLPGTIIGENVLVGACSVVKGIIPDNSIVIGNPARIIGKTSEWIEKQMDIDAINGYQ